MNEGVSIIYPSGTLIFFLIEWKGVYFICGCKDPQEMLLIEIVEFSF